MNQKMWYI
uniref:Uncharacterized protein n=1 Tax=Arundo donax TaxID=35708 RepID=A0A0A9ARS8_ARUDO